MPIPDDHQSPLRNFAGTFAGDAMAAQVAQFEALLPENHRGKLREPKAQLDETGGTPSLGPVGAARVIVP